MEGSAIVLPAQEDLVGWRSLIDRLEPPIEDSHDEKELENLRQRMLGAIINMARMPGRRTRVPHPARYEGPYLNRPE